MNLAYGKIINDDECDNIIKNLDKGIIETLAKPTLNYMTVINACQKLSEKLDTKTHSQILTSIGISEKLATHYINEAKMMLSKDYLMEKVKKELGENYEKPNTFTPLFSTNIVTEQILPLGVLFHIAAGNMNGLPFYTIIEGLLTGNINILKLPQEEGGITVMLFLELFSIEPTLSEYVYVFDITSKDVKIMKSLADLADAIVIWGGSDAITSVRKMAKASTKIIEWGHKISFAYVTQNGATDENLKKISENICDTNQLLCSSCQGVFFDCSDEMHVHSFAKRFLKILEETNVGKPLDLYIGLQSANSLKVRTEQLNSIYNDKTFYKGNGCSVTVSMDSLLETSLMYRNCWVKPLVNKNILEVLRPYKNFLQTVGLYCDLDERDSLLRLFSGTGVVVVTQNDMSGVYCGMAHDGGYALRMYSKRVCCF